MCLGGALLQLRRRADKIELELRAPRKRSSSLPLYEYRCTQCGHRLEKIQSFSSAPLTECPNCHGLLERLLTAPALQFKGAGWYVNDYAGKAKSSSDASAAESSSGSTSSDKPKTGSAPAASGSKPAASESRPAAPPSSSSGTSGASPSSGASSSSTSAPPKSA